MAIALSEISRKIADLDNIPTVPALLVPLLKRLGEPAEDVNVTEIVNLISYDKSLTAQCLHMANSPLYGRWTPLDNLRTTVIALGMQRMRDIALSCTLLTLVPRGRTSVDPAVFWEHSLGCALVCRQFAHKIGFPDPAKAYLAGLLHDVGVVAELCVVPEEFQAALDLARSQGIPLHEAEATALGLTHCDSGKIVAQNVVVLPDDPRNAIQPMIAAIRKLMAAHSDRSFDGIGICLPGRADPLLEEAIFAPNLKWPIASIKSRIQKATELRVEMDNVANACALSEVWFGDSDGLHDLVVVNVSEGIGTGIFANGRLLRGANGMAGEFGHVQMDAEGPECGCGSRGCWETIASNRAGLRYYQEYRGTAVPSFAALLKMAQADDACGVKALEKMALALGRGLRMIASALAPSEIIIVGDITNAWHRFGPLIEMELRKNALSGVPKLRPSFEGNAARLRSAVALVMNGNMV